MSFSGAFYMEGAPEYEQRSGGSRGKHVSAALRMARQSCCGRGEQRSGGGAAEVLRTDARVLLRNNPVVDTPAVGCYI